MELVPSTTHRLPAADRRRQLIEAAMDLFSRKGFAGTTTKEIAHRRGRFRGHHFPAFRHQARSIYGDHRAQHSFRWGQEVLAGIEDCIKRHDDEGLFRLIARE